MNAEYLETFFFVSEVIQEEINKNNPALIDLVSNYGRFELVELAKDIANKFQEINAGREWDGEFLEEVDSFTHEQIKNL